MSEIDPKEPEEITADELEQVACSDTISDTTFGVQQTSSKLATAIAYAVKLGGSGF